MRNKNHIDGKEFIFCNDEVCEADECAEYLYNKVLRLEHALDQSEKKFVQIVESTTERIITIKMVETERVRKAEDSRYAIAKGAIETESLLKSSNSSRDFAVSQATRLDKIINEIVAQYDTTDGEGYIGAKVGGILLREGYISIKS